MQKPTPCGPLRPRVLELLVAKATLCNWNYALAVCLVVFWESGSLGFLHPPRRMQCNNSGTCQVRGTWSISGPLASPNSR